MFLDAHVHCYPEYDLDLLFDSFIGNAHRLAPSESSFGMIVLLRDFQPSLESLFPSERLHQWKITPPSSENFAATASNGSFSIALYPARQIAARERIELLALFGETCIPDGLSLLETTRQIRTANLTPVIAWGKGKWLFKRAGIVRKWLTSESTNSPAPFVGDSGLRPRFWLEPLFWYASYLGLKILRGSDPLPKPNQEQRAGSCASVIPTPDDLSFSSLFSSLAKLS